MLRINQFLFDLYSCPASPGRWPVALDQLCRMLRVCNAVVQIIRPEGGYLRSRWMVRDSRSEAASALHDRYFSDSVNPRFLVKRPPPSVDQQIFRDSDIFEPTDPLLSDLKIRLAAAGLGRYLSARMLMPGNEGLTLVVHRAPNDEQDYTRREERVVLELMPHLRQAIELAGTLRDARRQASELHETIDSFRFALLICEADGSVCWSNTAAQRILARRQALWVNAGRLLTTPSSRQTTEVRTAIAQAALDPSGCSEPRVFALGGNGPNPLQIRVQALERARSPADTHQLGNPEGRALIVLSDPNSDTSLPPELLKRLFGLSPAESRLASALCVGATLSEYAAQAGVTVSTARYQLKQVMAKTRVSKQSQLVQRLCSAVVFHMRT